MLADKANKERLKVLLDRTLGALKHAIPTLRYGIKTMSKDSYWGGNRVDRLFVEVSYSENFKYRRESDNRLVRRFPKPEGMSHLLLGIVRGVIGLASNPDASEEKFFDPVDPEFLEDRQNALDILVRTSMLIDRSKYVARGRYNTPLGREDFEYKMHLIFNGEIGNGFSDFERWRPRV